MSRENDPALRSIGWWVVVINRHFQTYKSLRFGHLGLGAGELSVLGDLCRRDGVIQEEVAASIVADKSSVARALNSLEQKCYVRREPDGQDRRKNRVYLTTEGEALKPELRQGFMEWTEAIAGDFSEQGRDQVILLLKRIAGNAAETVKRMEPERQGK